MNLFTVNRMKIVMRNYSKIIVAIGLLCLAGYGVYYKVSSYYSLAYPKLNFEQSCPDSAGLRPIFTWNNDNAPYLEKLRQKFGLDAIVIDYHTDLEKILAITNWVHHLWEHNGDNAPEKSDPISVLTEVIEDKKQFRCVEYSNVTAGCLNALGIPARTLSLRTADVETRAYGAGHVVIEAYLAELNTWIMVDTQANVIPVLDGKPLNAVELQEALAQKPSGLTIMSHAPGATFDEYVSFIKPYLYYFQTALEQSYNDDSHQIAKSVMLVPIGAKNPTIFQITSPIVNVEYTHSVACFYQKPVMI